jgi:pterin-4a-carbinolamine dehydratase
MEAKHTLSNQGPAGSLEPKVRRPPRPVGLRWLKPERVQEMLRAMTGWRLLPGDVSIGRIREFADAGAAAAYAAFVAELAGRDGHPFKLEQAGTRITVTLYGPLSRKGEPMGITTALIETARALG